MRRASPKPVELPVPGCLSRSQFGCMTRPSVPILGRGGIETVDDRASKFTTQTKVQLGAAERQGTGRGIGRGSAIVARRGRHSRRRRGGQHRHTNSLLPLRVCNRSHPPPGRHQEDVKSAASPAGPRSAPRRRQVSSTTQTRLRSAHNRTNPASRATDGDPRPSNSRSAPSWCSFWQWLASPLWNC